jgi:hypothetical protein
MTDDTAAQAAEMLATLERMRVDCAYVRLDWFAEDEQWSCWWVHAGQTRSHTGDADTAPEAVAACWAKGAE